MECFKIVLDKLKKDVQKKMGNLSAVKISDEKFERLSERSDKSSKDYKIPTWIEEANNPRVAMDFSYGTGRVVIDPKEAAEIARGERSGSGQKTTRFQSLTPAPLDSLRFGPHLTQGYYHGTLSRDQAEEMIMRTETNGAFIVRDSKNRPGCLVITYLYALRPHHQYVMPVALHDKAKGENIFLATCDRDTVFYDVHSLIDYHRLNRGSLQCMLTVSVKNPLQPDGTPPRHSKPGPSLSRSPKSKTSSPKTETLQQYGSLNTSFRDDSVSPQLASSDSDRERQILSPLPITLEADTTVGENTYSPDPTTVKNTSPPVDLLTTLEIHSDPNVSLQPLSPRRSPRTGSSASSRDGASPKSSPQLPTRERRSDSPRV